jgi:undecaprenyl-diphosphatase
VKTSGSYSFFSGHAANSMAVATFIYLVMKPHFKYLFLLFLWPLVFAYSHLSGITLSNRYFVWVLIWDFSGYTFYKAHQYFQKKYFLFSTWSYFRYTFQSYTIKLFFNYNKGASGGRSFV